jgi:hypothetical protein
MGYLLDSFKKTARKATLATALTASLVAGGLGTQSAFAQQAGPPPQPSGGAQVTQMANGPTVAVNQWAQDEHYQHLIQAYDAQVAARMKIYTVNAESQHKIGDATMSIQEWNLEQQRGAYMQRGAAGWAQYGAVQAQITGAHEAQSVQIDAAYSNLQSREDLGRSQYVAQQDARFQALINSGQLKPGQPKTWAGDPQYQQALRTFDQQQAAIFKIDDATERSQLQVLDANHASQSISINTSQGPLVIRQGLPGIGRLGATDQIINATYKQQRVTIEATYEQKHAAMAAQREEFVFGQDLRFSQMAKYKVTAPTTQQAPGARTPGS